MRRPRPPASAPARHGLRPALPRLLPALAGSVLLTTALAGPATAGPAMASTAGASTAGAGAPINYVALGDSYTAGPLIPTLTGSPAGCARSTHNYPHLVAAAIGAASFKDVSCQGADTSSMGHSEGVPLGTNPPQLNAVSASTTVVTLQVGGNDIDFLGIVINCTVLSFTDPFGSPCKDHYTSGGTDKLRAAVDKTAPKIASVLKAVHQRAPHARVFLVGYPDILPNTGTGCWPRVPVAHGDVPYLRGVEVYLNRMLATQAAHNGATYVNTYTGSIGHDFCQKTGVKWIEGTVPTSPAAPVHPNALGEKGMATQVEATIG